MDQTTTTTCQVCGDTLGNSNIVFCSYCGTPHHHDCWQYTRQCSTYGCGCRQCRETPPDSASREEDLKEVMKIDSEGFGWLAGRKVKLSAKPSSRLAVLGREQSVPGDFTGTSNRLDIDTMLESFFSNLSYVVLFGSVIISIGSSSADQLTIIRFGLIVSSILMFIRLFIDCTYILDNQSRLLLYSRSIFGWMKTWKICEFSDIKRVGILAENYPELNRNMLYSIMLELPNNTSIEVSEPDDDFHKVDGYATVMATHLEADLLPSVEEVTSLQENGSVIPMIPWANLSDSRFIFGRPSSFEVGYFLLTALASIVALFL